MSRSVCPTCGTALSDPDGPCGLCTSTGAGTASDGPPATTTTLDALPAFPPEPDTAAGTAAGTAVGTAAGTPTGDSGSPLAPSPACPDRAAARGAALAPDSVIDGKYQVRAQIGAGGFGEVYRVHHLLLQREFALKTLHPLLAANPAIRERFLREARVLLDLDHPNLVTLRDLGRFGERPYMVMDLCPGTTLGHLLRERGRLPARTAATLALGVLKALEYAHARGIVHRDLKPANLLVDAHPDGTWDVRVLDFGVAKLLDEAQPDGKDFMSLTALGAAVGTLPYMSPEQVGGSGWNSGAVDVRADLYSVGVILFQMVTGRRPFAGDTPFELARHIVLDPPPPLPPELAGDLPGLDAILACALAKEPDARFASAREFAAELEARVGGARRVRARFGPASADPHRAAAAAPAARAPEAAVSCLALSPDGRTLAALADNRELVLVDATTGHRERALPGPARDLTLLVFAPDGRTLASANRDGTVLLWNLAQAGDLRPLRGPAGTVTSLAFSPDGRRLAAGGGDEIVYLWDLAGGGGGTGGTGTGGGRAQRLCGHAAAVVALAFHPQRPLLASIASDRTLMLWDLTTGRELPSLAKNPGTGARLAFAPGGRSLATAGAEGIVKIWDATNARRLQALPARGGEITALAYAADGQQLAAAVLGQGVVLWDPADFSETRALVAPDVHIAALAFRDGGAGLVAAARDGWLLAWDLRLGEPEEAPCAAGGPRPTALPTPAAAAPGAAAAGPELIDGKYRVLENLGAGGYGQVYRVRHILLGRDFALKTSRSLLGCDARDRERMLHEARVLMRLQHPNIVTLRDVGAWQGGLYLVMDLCPGETLHAIARGWGQLSAPAAAQIGIQVLRALEFAHARGVVHRDLKPANLMLAPGETELWQVKVLDFGLAKALRAGWAGGCDPDDPASTGGGIGTLPYMSPEQVGRATGGGAPAEVDARADLYAVGVILYQLVAGRLPFDVTNPLRLARSILEAAPPAFASLGLGAVPAPFEDLVRRALAKQPSDRPASATEMLRRLEEVLRTAAPAAGTKGAGRAAPGPAPDARRAAAAAGSGVKPPPARGARAADSWLGRLEDSVRNDPEACAGLLAFGCTLLAVMALWPRVFGLFVTLPLLAVLLGGVLVRRCFPVPAPRRKAFLAAAGAIVLLVGVLTSVHIRRYGAGAWTRPGDWARLLTGPALAASMILSGWVARATERNGDRLLAVSLIALDAILLCLE